MTGAPSSEAVVVDASAVLAVLVELPVDEALRARLVGADLHAPHLLDLEVLSALRRLEQRGAITGEEAGKARRWFDDLLVERHPHHPLAERIWALRVGITAYDGAYVALAEVLGAPLVTTDRRLARSSGHGATVEAFGG